MELAQNKVIDGIVAHAREALLQPGDPVPQIGIILGTGWDVLPITVKREIKLSEIPGFPAPASRVADHARVLCYGIVAGIPVFALRGRYHMYEAPYDPRDPVHPVMLQTEIMIQCGVRDLVVTSAVGSLDPKIEPGTLVIADGFLSLFDPRLPMDMFESLEDVLCPKYISLRQSTCVPCVPGLPVTVGGHAMVQGP